MTVEYFVAGNGIIDDSGSSRMADRIAQDEAARGYPEAEKFAETWAFVRTHTQCGCVKKQQASAFWWRRWC